jgi:hypothetical protein
MSDEDYCTTELEGPIFALNTRRTLSHILVRRDSGEVGAGKFVYERVSGKLRNIKAKYRQYLNAFHVLSTEMWEVHSKTTSTRHHALTLVPARLNFRIAWSCT